MTEQLQTTWFLLVFVLLAGYAILDGFDLGVGTLHLFATFAGARERERRVNINAIGPVWDGNEVWLLTGGGALFAAFPPVYACVFSGFYIALMLLLAALIARAVSMEFRSKVESPTWRHAWDIAFGVGSLLPPVLFGVAFGNILRGIPLDARGEFTGSFFSLLNPFSVLIGTLTLSLFTMHGAIWLALKTDGEGHDRAARIIAPLWWVTLIQYAAATVATVFVSPFLFERIFKNPLAWILLVLLVPSFIAVRKLACGCTKQYGWAMLASGASIAAMMGLAGVSLFPRLVPARNDLTLSLTAFAHSSTQRTLLTMLVIALVGMPLVIGYTAFIYRAFRGKVILAEESY